MDDVFETVAYHKNGLSTAQKNVRSQQFYISSNKPFKELWLGNGIYFWERKEDADWWDGKYKIDTILSAKLSCPMDQFVNLDDQDDLQSFLQFCKQAYNYLSHLHDINIDFNGGSRQLMTVFANTFKESNDILLMKYSFPKENNRPQYCATDNSVISNVQIVAYTKDSRLVWC